MSSNASKLRDSLFDTMKIFSEKAASSNGATITIEGQVKSIIDEAKGEYMVDYLGNAIPAHSKSSEKYQVGDNIYVFNGEERYIDEGHKHFTGPVIDGRALYKRLLIKRKIS